MKKGTLLVKKPNRDELYWVITFFASYFTWHGAYRVLNNTDTAAYVMAAVVIALIVIKFTLLRNWSVNHVEWSMDSEYLYLDGKQIPLDSFKQIYFQRNKLTGYSWFLHAKGMYRVRLESLSYPTAKKEESIETMKELAFALDPTLVNKPRLLPD